MADNQKYTFTRYSSYAAPARIDQDGKLCWYDEGDLICCSVCKGEGGWKPQPIEQANG